MGRQGVTENQEEKEYPAGCIQVLTGFLGRSIPQSLSQMISCWVKCQYGPLENPCMVALNQIAHHQVLMVTHLTLGHGPRSQLCSESGLPALDVCVLNRRSLYVPQVRNHAFQKHVRRRGVVVEEVYPKPSAELNGRTFAKF